MDALLFQTPDNPFPDPSGTRHIAGRFDTRDGLKLRYAIFKTQTGTPKGTVVLLHGRNETIEKYYETIADLNAHGLWVATFDWRGQGGSARILPDYGAGYVRRFSDYEADLEDFLETVVLPDARLPFFLVAHSTGGLVALSAAPRLGNRIDRMVLSAPFVALGHQRFGQSTIGFVTRAMQLFGLGRRLVTKSRYPRPFEGNPLTHDRRRFARNGAIFETAPSLAPSNPTARWISEAIRAMRRVGRADHLASIAIPTVILAAGADTITPPAAVEHLHGYFRASRLVMIDGARHELFQESDRYRDQALAALTAFLPGGAEEHAA